MLVQDLCMRKAYAYCADFGRLRMSTTAYPIRGFRASPTPLFGMLAAVHLVPERLFVQLPPKVLLLLQKALSMQLRALAMAASLLNAFTRMRQVLRYKNVSGLATQELSKTGYGAIL